MVSILGRTLLSLLSNEVMSDEQPVYRDRITSSQLMLMITFICRAGSTLMATEGHKHISAYVRGWQSAHNYL